MSEEGVAEGMNGMRKQRRVLAGRRLQGGQGGGPVGGWGMLQRASLSWASFNPTPSLLCPTVKWAHYGLCEWRMPLPPLGLVLAAGSEGPWPHLNSKMQEGSRRDEQLLHTPSLRVATSGLSAALTVGAGPGVPAEGYTVGGGDVGSLLGVPPGSPTAAALGCTNPPAPRPEGRASVATDLSPGEAHPDWSL